MKIAIAAIIVILGVIGVSYYVLHSLEKNSEEAKVKRKWSDPKS